MCLATIYLDKDNSVIMENTSKITVDGVHVELMDLFGIRKNIEGSIKTIDLENNKVVIQQG